MRLAQLLERLALGLRQLRRHLDAQPREQVARPSPFSFGAPRPLTRSSLPSSVPAGTFNETRPSGRRDLDLGAERGLGERDRHLEHEVVAAALVELRRLDARDDVEVAGRRAAAAGLALALQLDLRAVLDARRDATV